MTSRRDDLPPRERAVSDTLDELNERMHGITASWAYPEEFLEWLDARGYVVEAKPDPEAEAAVAQAALAEIRATLDGVIDQLHKDGLIP